MRIRRILLACAVVGLLPSAAAVQAQYNNSGSSSKGLSSRTTSGRQGIFGNRSELGTRGGGGFSSTSGAQGDFASPPSTRNNRQAGGFVGGNSQDRQRFVGGVQADANANNWMQSMGSMFSSTPGGGNFIPRQNANSRRGEGSAASQNPVSSIRTEYRVAFDCPKPNTQELSTSLTRRLAEARAIQTQSPIRVELQGRTAILRGVASTEHARLLAERMIRLEPGIEAVKNEIAVAKPTPSEAPRP